MTHSGESWRLGHRPALDGLRGLAVALVVLTHLGVPGGVPVGQAGVSAFFVLSGFLITALLLEQSGRHGRIRFGTFYRRRALRLGPAFLACVAVVSAVAGLAGIPVGPNAAVALLYLMDFLEATRSTFAPGLFSHTWSLAVEEQFYLLWPVVLLVMLRLRVSLGGTLTAGAVVLTGWTLWLGATGASAPRIVCAPDTRAAGLLAGCALAAFFASRPMPTLPGWAFLAALVSLPAVGFLPDFWLSGVVGLVLTVPISVVLVWACVTGRPVPVLSTAPLRVLGQRSYGVYLWHVPLLAFADHWLPGAAWWVRAVVALAVTAVVVEVSWRKLEKPILRLGRRRDAQESGWMAEPSAASLVRSRQGVDFHHGDRR